MARKTTAGYIVQAVHPNYGSRAMEQALDFETGNQELYFGSVATLFRKRPHAKGAIRRTVKARPNFESEQGRLTITRLVGE